MAAKRRMSMSSSYIGSGNMPSVFNRKPREGFQKIRKRYERELLQVNYSNSGQKTVSKDEMELIRKKIALDIRKNNYRQIVIVAISILLTGLIVYLSLDLIRTIVDSKNS